MFYQKKRRCLVKKGSENLKKSIILMKIKQNRFKYYLKKDDEDEKTITNYDIKKMKKKTICKL